ncbi:hypothetical protein B9Z19DRAFT_1094279 [Tuber borchii]|uniref:Uncharacterized protein n=1 Tax=Tuber borchii TaxID=42251 RepID=A0A2T6ZEC2_TUBBO|nr:hypothetical protein B9Z19DRAFT_1094279 [Tuber borchii]
MLGELDAGRLWGVGVLCRDRWKDGRKVSLLLYILLSLPLISWLSAVIVSKQLNEKKFPTLSCELAIKGFCAFYSWRFVSFCRRTFCRRHNRRFAVQP